MNLCNSGSDVQTYILSGKSTSPSISDYLKLVKNSLCQINKFVIWLINFALKFFLIVEDIFLLTLLLGFWFKIITCARSDSVFIKRFSMISSKLKGLSSNTVTQNLLNFYQCKILTSLSFHQKLKCFQTIPRFICEMCMQYVTIKPAFARYNQGS